MSENSKKIDLSGVFILVADRNMSVLRSLKRSLTELGATVYLAANLTTARMTLAQKLIHGILADIDFDQNNAVDLASDYRSIFPDGLVFLMADKERIDEFQGLKQFPVQGFFSKPVDVDSFARQLKTDSKMDSSSISRLDPLTEILRPYLIFRSPMMRRALIVLPKIAASSHSVLITGETGTGKEMVARAIHELSPFSNGPFVAVNCGAIPESLIEGELFGHEKGSFTGAQTQHRGKFELAKNGTLFLDEIGEMPLALQARLLRVLEEHQFYRVGGEKPINIELRIVAATQVNLEKSVDEGLFREDLYYRLNVLRIHLPALRDRIEDIPLLAWFFLERAFAELGRNKPYPALSADVIQILINQRWKGNVRELKNLMTRLAVLLPRGVDEIVPEYLAVYFPEKVILESQIRPKFDTQNDIQDIEIHPDSNVIEVSSYPSEEGTFIPIKTTMKEAEELLIQAALRHTDGNRTKAAKLLGIGLRTIRRKINEIDDDL